MIHWTQKRLDRDLNQALQPWLISGWYTVLILLPDFAQLEGVSDTKASFLISIIGIFNALFRVLSVALAHFFPKYLKPQLLWCLLGLVASGVTFWLPHMASNAPMILAAVFTGLLLGRYYHR